jgi:hypothetical protein
LQLSFRQPTKENNPRQRSCRYRDEWNANCLRFVFA